MGVREEHGLDGDPELPDGAHDAVRLVPRIEDTAPTLAARDEAVLRDRADGDIRTSIGMQCI
jgi:hypothetical protein